MVFPFYTRTGLKSRQKQTRNKLERIMSFIKYQVRTFRPGKSYSNLAVALAKSQAYW